jgi:sigma-B regulation protein RsbU (phosphoserine phosphatase)
VVDTQAATLTYSIGGHLPLPIMFSQGQAQYLPGRGLPVGLFAEATYQDHVMTLPESYSLTLLSDGILDLLPGDSLKEKEALLPELVSAAGGTLAGLRKAFGLAKLGEMPDDIALLVMSRNLA